MRDEKNRRDRSSSVDSELALVLAGDYSLSMWQPNPYFIGFKNKSLHVKSSLRRSHAICCKIFSAYASLPKAPVFLSWKFFLSLGTDPDQMHTPALLSSLLGKEGGEGEGVVGTVILNPYQKEIFCKAVAFPAGR